MPYYTEEQIIKARSIDLLTYLQTYEPTELVHVRGNTYCTRDHDSLKISNGKWMWWSRGFGGSSALDYLIKVKGLQFMDAMQILTNDRNLALNNAPVLGESRQSKGNRKLLLPDRSETNCEVIRYLTSRGIDREIIKASIDEGLLYESLPYHNCIFVGFDESGNAAYAFHVFESAIDLLSYATIMKMRTGEWRAEPMVSLGGVYAPSVNKKQSKLPIALENMTQNQTQINTIALHLDNDYAGKIASDNIALQLCGDYTVRIELPPYGKDCNDYLQQLQRQKHSKQMGRE